MYRLRLDAEPSVIGKNWNPERRYCHWLELFATPSWFLFIFEIYSSKKILARNIWYFGIFALLLFPLPDYGV